MIVFVGKEEKGFFIQKVAEKHNWKTGYITPDLDIRNQVSEILEYPDIKIVVYDIEQYAVSGEIVADVIERIQKANNAKPVIYAEGYHPQMDIIKKIAFKGIDGFIFGTFLADKKEELEECISGNGRKLEYEDSLIEAEENVGDAAVARTIGIAGSIGRMGATTQAIQFVKYLFLKGYRACYIQMNDHGWVEELKEAYADVVADEAVGKVTYQAVDMYYKLEKLPEVMKMGYDFYVYDYGVYSERGFNKVSFLEKELQVFVVGTKPGEFMKTYELIANNFYNKVSYIFNFIKEDEAEHEDTYELMQEKSKVTYFAADCRDPFVYSGSGIYEQMLPVEAIVKESRKKKPFWRRK